MKAIWENTVLAESNDTVVVDGNHYFPRDSLKMDLFKESSTNTLCPWKGRANYLSVTIDGKTNIDCAWYYPKPSMLAKKIKDRVAFWNGVEVKN